MFDWRLDILIPVLITVALSVLAAILEPTLHPIKRIRNRIFRRGLVRVEVQQDPGVLLAGKPDWEPFAAWVPREPSVAPPVPVAARNLLRDLDNLGAQAALWQVIEVRLASRAPLTIEAIEVSSEVMPKEPGGCIYAMSVGGAELLPHAVDIQLTSSGDPVATLDSAGDRRSLAEMRYSLAVDEIESWIFRASASAEDQGWWLQLRVRSMGDEWTIRIPRSGSFILRTGQGRKTYLAGVGSKWIATSEPL